jgi:hypothetical protein
MNAIRELMEPPQPARRRIGFEVPSGFAKGRNSPKVRTMLPPNRT